MAASLVRKSLELFESESGTKGQGKKCMVDLSKQPGVKLKRKNSRGKKGLTVDEVRKKLRSDTDRTQQNLQCLQQLSGSQINDDIANKILERAGKTKKEVELKKPPVEQTVFSEEDFEKFEKEYFGAD